MASGTLTLEDIVSKTTDLPTIPAAALAVIRETDSPTATARGVAMHIGQDQALAARVLRLANSAYYGLQRQIMDHHEAVVILGMRCIRNLAMVAATYPWMTRPLKGYSLGPKEMWTHSFGVAIASQMIAKRTGAVNEEAAFTAGLLHNLGKVALSIWLENKLQAMMALAVRDDLTFDEVERKILGYDHADVGAYLGEKWNLPPPLVETMRYHHNPEACEPRSALVDCVHIGDYLTMSMGYGLGGDGLRYEFSDECVQRLNIQASDFDAITSDFVAAYEEYAKLFEGMDQV
jgi:putative nucleotidyltransferase with HDIG domain